MGEEEETEMVEKQQGVYDDEQKEKETITEEQQADKDENVLKFLDSADSYLVLMDSLSSTLRQGWLELASARHSMGTFRINSAVLDLKYHTAATTVQVQCHDDGSNTEHPHFALRKWASADSPISYSGEAKFEEEDDDTHLHEQAASQNPEHQGRSAETKDSPRATGDQRERLKSLSMFGTLVCPKLRSAQLSFETVLETLIETANMRSSLLCSHNLVQKEILSNTK